MLGMVGEDKEPVLPWILGLLILKVEIWLSSGCWPWPMGL